MGGKDGFGRLRATPDASRNASAVPTRQIQDGFGRLPASQMLREMLSRFALAVRSRGSLSQFALVVRSRGSLSRFALVVRSRSSLSWFALAVRSRGSLSRFAFVVPTQCITQMYSQTLVELQSNLHFIMQSKVIVKFKYEK